MKKGDPKVPFFIADPPAKAHWCGLLLGKKLDPGDIGPVADAVAHL